MVGPIFATEEAAVEAIDAWSVKTMCPLSKIRYNKGLEKNRQYIKVHDRIKFLAGNAVHNFLKEEL